MEFLTLATVLVLVLAATIAEDMRRWAAKRAAEDAVFEESLRKTRSRLDEVISAWKADAAR